MRLDPNRCDCGALYVRGHYDAAICTLILACEAGHVSRLTDLHALHGGWPLRVREKNVATDEPPRV